MGNRVDADVAAAPAVRLAIVGHGAAADRHRLAQVDGFDVEVLAGRERRQARVVNDAPATATAAAGAVVVAGGTVGGTVEAGRSVATVEAEGAGAAALGDGAVGITVLAILGAVGRGRLAVPLAAAAAVGDHVGADRHVDRGRLEQHRAAGAAAAARILIVAALETAATGDRDAPAGADRDAGHGGDLDRAAARAAVGVAVAGLGVAEASAAAGATAAQGREGVIALGRAGAAGGHAVLARAARATAGSIASAAAAAGGLVVGRVVPAVAAGAGSTGVVGHNRRVAVLAAGAGRVLVGAGVNQAVDRHTATDREDHRPRTDQPQGAAGSHRQIHQGEQDDIGATGLAEDDRGGIRSAPVAQRDGTTGVDRRGATVERGTRGARERNVTPAEVGRIDGRAARCAVAAGDLGVGEGHITRGSAVVHGEHHRSGAGGDVLERDAGGAALGRHERVDLIATRIAAAAAEGRLRVDRRARSEIGVVDQEVRIVELGGVVDRLGGVARGGSPASARERCGAQVG